MAQPFRPSLKLKNYLANSYDKKWLLNKVRERDILITGEPDKWYLAALLSMFDLRLLNPDDEINQDQANEIRKWWKMPLDELKELATSERIHVQHIQRAGVIAVLIKNHFPLARPRAQTQDPDDQDPYDDGDPHDQAPGARGINAQVNRNRGPTMPQKQASNPVRTGVFYPAVPPLRSRHDGRGLFESRLNRPQTSTKVDSVYRDEKNFSTDSKKLPSDSKNFSKDSKKLPNDGADLVNSFENFSIHVPHQVRNQGPLKGTKSGKDQKPISIDQFLNAVKYLDYYAPKIAAKLLNRPWRTLDRTEAIKRADSRVAKTREKMDDLTLALQTATEAYEDALERRDQLFRGCIDDLNSIEERIEDSDGTEDGIEGNLGL